MYVYMIECNDGSLYTGIAADIEKRLKQHFFQLKGCAKYTQSHKTTALRCLWQTEDKRTACQLEYHIKRLTRSEKLRLIDDADLLNLFFKEKLDCEKCHFLPHDIQNKIFAQVKA